MRKYKYEIQGTAAGDQTWMTEGQVEDPTNDLNKVLAEALRESFVSLTGGRAVYGQPGVGCNGPYGVSRVVLSVENFGQ